MRLNRTITQNLDKLRILRKNALATTIYSIKETIVDFFYNSLTEMVAIVITGTYDKPVLVDKVPPTSHFNVGLIERVLQRGKSHFRGIFIKETVHNSHII